MAVVRFRTLSREPLTFRKGFWSSFGFGLALEQRYRSAQPLPNSTTPHAELLLPLFARPDYSSFTVFGVGGMLYSKYIKFPQAAGLGPRLELSHRTHLFGPTSNALRAEVVYAPRYGVFGRERDVWTHDLTLSSRLDVVLWNQSRYPIVIGPMVAWSSERSKLLRDTDLSASLFVEVR
jgi:hypothetical protein